MIQDNPRRKEWLRGIKTKGRSKMMENTVARSRVGEKKRKKTILRSHVPFQVLNILNMAPGKAKLPGSVQRGSPRSSMYFRTLIPGGLGSGAIPLGQYKGKRHTCVFKKLNRKWRQNKKKLKKN